MRLAVVSALLAVSGACESRTSLGVTTLPCDGGDCLAPEVIADGATVDRDGAAELMRVANALEGTFVGGLFLPVPLTYLQDTLLTLTFTPDADPLTGRYVAECTGADCTVLFGVSFQGRYTLTGLNNLGRVKGYLTVEGEDFASAREVQSLYLDATGLVLLLGDATQPRQVIVVANRPEDAGAEGAP